MVGWIPSEASLGVFRWNGCLVVSAELPLSHELALASLQRTSNEVLGHPRWKEDEDRANKRWYRKKTGGDIAMGTAACGAAVLWKGAGHLTAGLFWLCLSLSPDLPVKECWENTRRTHWQEATRLYRETAPPAVKYHWQTVVSFSFFFFFDRHRRTAEPRWGDLSQLV